MSRANKPAYPNHGDGSRWDGMTIRERFVMAAMQGMCANRDWTETPEHGIAVSAIKQADATLAALDQKAG